MNSSGRVLTIFLVITAILLISLTAISLFFFQKETERRKVAEATLEELHDERGKLEENLKEIKKQNFLLHEKNKEADDRINDLSDELELEKGLREAMKTETDSMKKEIEEAKAFKAKYAEEIKKKENAQAELEEKLAVSEEKIKTLEGKLKEEVGRQEELGKLYEQQKEQVARLEDTRASQEANQDSALYSGAIADDISESGIELEEIIVAAKENIDAEPDRTKTGMLLQDTVGVLDKALEGRILSVDTETEFVIVSLGETHGVEVGNVLSVYRGANYVGDIRITRLQPEMSAADLIPPFSIKSVKKNDQVKIK